MDISNFLEETRTSIVEEGGGHNSMLEPEAVLHPTNFKGGTPSAPKSEKREKAACSMTIF